jgi:hypothetical protein
MKLLPELSWSASVSAKVVNAFVCRSFLPPLHWCLFLVPYLSQCPETAMLCCKSLIRNITQTDIKHKKTKQNITSPCITSDHITSHYITLRYTTLHYTKPHYTTLHYIALHYTTFHSCFALRYTTSRNLTLHHITWHYTTVHYIIFQYIYIILLQTNTHTQNTSIQVVPHTYHQIRQHLRAVKFGNGTRPPAFVEALLLFWSTPQPFRKKGSHIAMQADKANKANTLPYLGNVFSCVQSRWSV